LCLDRTQLKASMQNRKGQKSECLPKHFQPLPRCNSVQMLAPTRHWKPPRQTTRGTAGCKTSCQGKKTLPDTDAVLFLAAGGTLQRLTGIAFSTSAGWHSVGAAERCASVGRGEKWQKKAKSCLLCRPACLRVGKSLLLWSPPNSSLLYKQEHGLPCPSSTSDPFQAKPTQKGGHQDPTEGIHV